MRLVQTGWRIERFLALVDAAIEVKQNESQKEADS
jgi:hypothetical protein